MKKTASILALAGMSGMAIAQVELQVDIDALSAEASDTFSDDYTGDLTVFGSIANPDLDGDASILDVIIDGNAQGTAGADHLEFSFEMAMSFASGEILSGELSLSVDGNGSENTYTADMVPSNGGAILAVGNTFLISALTTNGNFADANGTLLGVDISPWGSNVDGFFTQIDFNPNGNIDVDTDVDVFMIVPAPGSALALIGGLGLLGRRRR